MAVMGAAGAGIFLGSNQYAQSDIAKFSAMLAEHERVPGEAIVKLSKSGMASVASLHNALGAERFGLTANVFETDHRFYKVTIARDADMAAFLDAANKNSAIAYAEPNYVVRALGQRDSEVIPNDSDFDKLWGLKNVGQKDSAGTVGKAGADIGATRAWVTTTGNRAIKVAIIDTGVDYNHPDLKDNIYMNPGEFGGGKEANGIDDDGNGFVDDYRGWNFAGVSTNDPMDDNEHGTHVAGTIGGQGNDGRGVVGVNWTTSIIPVKFLTGAGSGTLEDAVKSVQYATKMGAHVMNNSWGGGGFTQSLYDVINEAKMKGLLFVAAAGNDSQNADNYPHYPAGYQIDNVIAVAATTNLDTMASFSTYGKRTVHIAAPGHKIYSSVPNNGYDSFSGTSMATPHVVGAAALVWGSDPSMSYLQVKDRLLMSRDYLPTMARKVMSGGRLNVYNALHGIYPPSPEPAEGSWRDFPMNGVIESAHPYAANAKQEWTVDGPADAKFIRIVFSKVDTEANYDFLKIFDASGAEVDAISGKAENAASYFVPGNKLTLKFTSDNSIQGWGFAVSKIQVVY